MTWLALSPGGLTLAPSINLSPQVNIGSIVYNSSTVAKEPANEQIQQQRGHAQGTVGTLEGRASHTSTAV